jgi:hypothetical protein
MLTLVSRAVERGASITKWTAENKFANVDARVGPGCCEL